MHSGHEGGERKAAADGWDEAGRRFQPLHAVLAKTRAQASPAASKATHPTSVQDGQR